MCAAVLGHEFVIKHKIYLGTIKWGVHLKEYIQIKFFEPFSDRLRFIFQHTRHGHSIYRKSQ